MDFKSAFLTIMAAGGSVAAIGFIAKLFANTLASAAIARFGLINSKALEDQKLSHKKELEDVKLQLAKLQKEHEIVFGSLYKKRDDVIANLYKIMSELTVLADSKSIDPSIEIDEKFRSLIDYFEMNRLYFPQEVAKEINSVMNTVFRLIEQQDKERFEQLVFQLKIQVYDHMESTFRELLKTEAYR